MVYAARVQPTCGVPSMFLTMQIFAVCALLIGALALFGGFRFRRRARQSETWHQVPARVLDFDVVHHDDTDFPYYAPKIRYRYMFSGSTHESKVFRQVFDAQLGEAEIDAWRQRYRPGTQITVYVNPDNPKQAAVEKHAPRALLWGLLLFGSVFAFVGAILFVVSTVLAHYAPQ